MNFAPTPEEISVLEDARAAAPSLAARADEADRRMRFPVEDLQDLQAANLHALAVPRCFGGRQVSTVAYVLAAETLAAADASLTIGWVMHTACGWEVAHCAPPKASRSILSDVVCNGAFICIAGSEGRAPDGSPDPVIATPMDAGWVLRGRKGFASGSEAATYVLTGGITESGVHHSFVLPMDTPGLSIGERWDGMGMRGSASHGLVFEDVQIGDSAHLSASYRDGDFRNTSALFGLGLAATALGIGQAALDFTVSFLSNRTVSDVNLARMGDISLNTEAARGLLWRAAWEADQNVAAAEVWVDRAKAVCVETAQQVTVDALRVCGGNAFRQKFPLERHVRDAAALLLQGQRPDQLRIGVAEHLRAKGADPNRHHPAAP